MRLFRDIETDKFYTIEELETEFNELKANNETEMETFEDYLKECTSKNGTLEEMPSEWFEGIENNEVLSLDWNITPYYRVNDSEDIFSITLFSNFQDYNNNVNGSKAYSFIMTLDKRVEDSKSCKVNIDGKYYYFG